jgi:hypothetical protein
VSHFLLILVRVGEDLGLRDLRKLTGEPVVTDLALEVRDGGVELLLDTLTSSGRTHPRRFTTCNPPFKLLGTLAERALELAPVCLAAMRRALLTPAQPIAAACHQAKPLPESPGNPGKALRPGVEDAHGMLLAPRRGVDDRRAAVNNRPNVRDYPSTLTGMMIEQRHGAEPSAGSVVPAGRGIHGHGGRQRPWLWCRFRLPRVRYCWKRSFPDSQILRLAAYGIETSP